MTRRVTLSLQLLVATRNRAKLCILEMVQEVQLSWAALQPGQSGTTTIERI
jgi:hypothetical protein